MTSSPPVQPPEPPPVPPLDSPSHRLGLAMYHLTVGAAVVLVISLMEWPLGVMLVGIGLIWSVVGLFRKNANRRVAVARLIVCLGLLAVQMAVIIPMRENTRRMASVTSCRICLTNIGKAIAAYTSDYGGQYPPDLETLVVNGHLASGDWMECSVGRVRSGRAPIFYKHFYCAPPSDDDMQDDVLFILSCDVVPARHPTGLFDNLFSSERYRYVVLSDFSVQQYTESEFQRELQKPQNRHFAAEMAKGAQLMPPYNTARWRSPSSQPSSQRTQEETDE